MASYTAGTYFIKTKEVKKNWMLVDASNSTLGRLATQIAKILMGKNKPYYTPHVDCGDNIVVINAEKIKLTGKKLQDKVYYWHTGYPGGIKQKTANDILTGAHPERVLKKAVERMMPKESPLARKQLRNLYIYQGEKHLHDAQKPVSINLNN